MIKSERREKIRKNQRKMIVRGRSIFTLMRIKTEKAFEARKGLSLCAIVCMAGETDGKSPGS